MREWPAARSLGRPVAPDIERAIITVGDSYVDAVVGYRTWWVSLLEGRAFLSSVFIPSAKWLPGQDAVSRCCCRGDDQRLRRIPGACKDTCGIYAFHDYAHAFAARMPRSALTDLYGIRVPQESVTVRGQVYLWGKVKVHERGYRAEFARPAAFYADWKDERQRLRVQMAAQQFDVPLLEVS